MLYGCVTLFGICKRNEQDWEVHEHETTGVNEERELPRTQRRAQPGEDAPTRAPPAVHRLAHGEVEPPTPLQQLPVALPDMLKSNEVVVVWEFVQSIYIHTHTAAMCSH